MRATRAALPAASMREQLLRAAAASHVVVISGATGCGKSTQVGGWRARWRGGGRVGGRGAAHVGWGWGVWTTGGRAGAPACAGEVIGRARMREGWFWERALGAWGLLVVSVLGLRGALPSAAPRLFCPAHCNNYRGRLPY